MPVPTVPTRPKQVRPTDPFVRWVVGDRQPAASIVDGDAIAWLGRASKPGESWITAFGDDPVVVAGLVEQLDAEHHVDGITVPEDAFDLLPERLRSPDPGHWCFWTLDPAGLDLPPTIAVGLDLDDSRIAPLLQHSDSAYLFPGNPAIVRWAGVVEGDRLLSVAGQITESTGAAHLVSVCTDPAERGRGLGREACLGIMHAAVADGAPMLVLEMYVANEPGRRTYRGLGFTEVARYRSGLLAHALPH